MVKRRAAGLLMAAAAAMLLAGCAGFEGSAGSASVSVQDEPSAAIETTAAMLEGSWVEPVPGMPGKVQGLTLYPDGRAASIGMATLRFERWTFADGTLTLMGKSIGNGQTIPATMIWTVKDVSADALTLKRGELTTVFTRRR